MGRRWGRIAIALAVAAVLLGVALPALGLWKEGAEIHCANLAPATVTSPSLDLTRAVVVPVPTGVACAWTTPHGEISRFVPTAPWENGLAATALLAALAIGRLGRHSRPGARRDQKDRTTLSSGV